VAVAVLAFISAMLPFAPLSAPLPLSHPRTNSDIAINSHPFFIVLTSIFMSANLITIPALSKTGTAGTGKTPYLHETFIQ
jgi:hypothetical protein